MESDSDQFVKKIPNKNVDRSKTNNSFWSRITYDLLNLPPISQIIKENEPEENTIPALEPIQEYQKGRKRVIRTEPQTKNVRKLETRESLRSHEKNPAPHAKDFNPDWYEEKSGIELSLARGELADDYRIRNPKGIMFWVKVSGTKNGKPKTMPSIGQNVTLFDFKTGKAVGGGKMAHRYFTRNRIMGYCIIEPLYWDLSAPFYYV